MVNVIVRPLALADLTYLIDMDHSYHTDYVWQMEYQSTGQEVKVRFKETRLPRSMRVEYPHDVERLIDDWKDRDGLLVAEMEEDPVGYISLAKGTTPEFVSVTDLVVVRRLRRQGIGMALVRAAQTWASDHNANRLVLEMQSKNYPAISMAQKLGFEFCGYSDRFYANQDIALFFAKRL